MTRQRISSGSSFEALASYSRAVVDGDWVFVSGTMPANTTVIAPLVDPRMKVEIEITAKRTGT